MSKAEALRTVTALGLRTIRGKSLTPQTFNELLKKPIYCGRIEIWSVDIRGDFETIVTEALFDRVQVVLRVNVGGAAGPHLRFNPDFPLRHFTCCAFCSKPLTGSSPKGRNGRYSYCHCRTRDCGAHNYPVSEVEDLFYHFVERLQPNPEMVALFRDAVVAAWKVKQADSERDTAVLKRRLAELNARKTQLRESLIYRQEISKHEYEEEKERLVEQMVLGRERVAQHFGERTRCGSDFELRGVRSDERRKGLVGSVAGDKTTDPAGSVSKRRSLRRRNIWNHQNQLGFQ
jgi:hypothetical protein